MTEKQVCEFIEGCPMFKYFRRIAKQIYMDTFCEGNPDICKRRQLRLAGEPVPMNLLPHGGKLWDDNARPPEYWGDD